MRIYMTIAVLLAALLLAGCNQEQAKRAPAPPEITTDQATPPVQSKDKEKPKQEQKQAQKPQTFKLGETAYYDQGKVTVLSYTPGVQSSNQFMQPKAGNQFAAIEVEGCANENAKTQVSLNPYYFELAMQDNTRLNASFGIAEPQLNHVDLLAGDCVRGFVTFEVPQDKQPKEVVFDQMGANKQPTKWTV